MMIDESQTQLTINGEPRDGQSFEVQHATLTAALNVLRVMFPDFEWDGEVEE